LFSVETPGVILEKYRRRRTGDAEIADLVGRIARVRELRHVTVLTADDLAKGIVGAVVCAELEF
jgi:hypothetical protein